MIAFKILPVHYQQISSWWQAHKWPVIPWESLPKNGLIVCDDKPIAAAWLYKTDSNICWMDFFVSNPDTTKLQRNEALDMLIDELTAMAATMGFKCIFTSLRVPKMISRLEKKGFVVGDKNMTNLTKMI